MVQVSLSSSKNKKPAPPDLLGYRPWGVAVRLFIVLLASYILSALTAASLSLVLPLPPADAVLTATMLAFFVPVIITISTFYIRSIQRLLTGITLAAICLILPLLLKKIGG